MDAGLIVINKPTGWTSRDCINRLERLARNVRFGHAGTLDPLATGVLIVAVDSATRLVEYLHELPKSYVAEFELGKSSRTLDIDSEVTVDASAHVPSLEELVRESVRWIGEVEQVPPEFSAIKVKGKRAYDLARSGKAVELEPRRVQIGRIEITHYEYPLVRMEIDCGSGTYVRSLGRDIARGCGTTAVMTSLVRTAVGCFPIQEAVPLEAITDVNAIERNLRPSAEGLNHWVSLILSDAQFDDVDHGRPLRTEGLRLVAPKVTYSHAARSKPITAETSSNENETLRVAAITASGRLAALLESRGDGYLRTKRVFHETPTMNQPSANSARQSPESS